MSHLYRPFLYILAVNLSAKKEVKKLKKKSARCVFMLFSKYSGDALCLPGYFS